MLKLAAAASLVTLSLLFFLSTDFMTSADASISSHRVCAITVVPTIETIVTNQLIVDQILQPLTSTAPITNQTTVITKKMKMKVPKSGFYRVSGYTSQVSQTDSRPCEASDGSDICKRKLHGELLCAAPRNIPLRTRMKVEGLGTCTVVDYMHERYTGKMVLDWYFGGNTKKNLRKALGIGNKIRAVTIVE